MSRRSHRHIYIEATVAFIVLAILLLVMVPRFYRSQISARAARAIQDMAAISQEMEAYNLISDTERIHTFIKPGSSSAHILADVRSVRPLEHRMLDQYSIKKMPHETLDDAAQLVPPQTYYSDENEDTDSVYSILMNDLTPRLKDAYLGAGNPLPPQSVSRFFQQSVEPNAYAGVYHGPCFRSKNIVQTFSVNGKLTTVSQTSLTEPYPFDMYNPTNGVVSHGYTVYRSEPSKAVKPLRPNFQYSIPNYRNRNTVQKGWFESYIAFEELMQNHTMYDSIKEFSSQSQTESDREFANYLEEHVKWYLFSENCAFHIVRTPLDIDQQEDMEKYIQFQKKIWPFEWQPKFPVMTITPAAVSSFLSKPITPNMAPSSNILFEER